MQLSLTNVQTLGRQRSDGIRCHSSFVAELYISSVCEEFQIRGILS